MIPTVLVAAEPAEYRYLQHYTMYDMLDVLVTQASENRQRLRTLYRNGRVVAAERYAEEDMVTVAIHVPGSDEKAYARPDTLRLYVLAQRNGKLQLIAHGWSQDDLLQGVGLLRLDINSFKINSSEYVIGVYYEPLRPNTVQTHSQRALLLYRLKDNQALPIIKTFHHRQFQAEITPGVTGTYLMRNDLIIRSTQTHGFYDIGSALVVYQIEGANLTKVREENTDYRWTGSIYTKD